MKALVLTGGFGTRLKEVINDRPKVMAPVGNKPFLSYLLQNLRKNGIFDVVLSIGYLGDYIRDYFKDGEDLGLKITYSEEISPLGTGGAVKVADKYFDEPYFVINGDTFSEINFAKVLEFHLKNKASLTVAVVFKKDIWESGYVQLDRGGKITAFIEKQKSNNGQKKSGLVNSGIYVLTPGLLKNVKKVRFSLERDFFPKLVSKGKVFGFRSNDDFIDIGTRKNYLLAKKLLILKRSRVIETSVPVRVSFAGGGTDFPEFFLKHGGAVVGASINKFAHVKLRTLNYPEIKINLLDFNKEKLFACNKFLPYDKSDFDLFKASINKLKPSVGFEANVWGDFVPASGLGTSSATTAAFIYALSTLGKKKLTSIDIAKMAIEVERSDLKIEGGYQDQYLCVLGGFNYLKFSKRGKIIVNRLLLSGRIVMRLEENLLLVFLGVDRSQKRQQEALLKNLGVRSEALLELKEIAKKISEALVAGELDKFGRLLDRAWILKKAHSDKISNDFIDKVYETAKSNGCLGGKILGAGGGGYLLLYCQPQVQWKVKRELEKLNVTSEGISFNLSGPEVRVYED